MNCNIYTSVVPCRIHKKNECPEAYNKEPNICYAHIQVPNKNIIISIITSCPGNYEKSHSQIIMDCLCDYFDRGILDSIITVPEGALSDNIDAYVAEKCSWFFKHTGKELSASEYVVLILDFDNKYYKSICSNSCVIKTSTNGSYDVRTTHKQSSGTINSSDCFVIFNAAVMDIIKTEPSLLKAFDFALFYKNELNFDIFIENLIDLDLLHTDDGIIRFISIIE